MALPALLDLQKPGMRGWETVLEYLLAIGWEVIVLCGEYEPGDTRNVPRARFSIQNSNLHPATRHNHNKPYPPNSDGMKLAYVVAMQSPIQIGCLGMDFDLLKTSELRLLGFIEQFLWSSI
ncbi:hypothetical protein HOY80DRAFT_1001891 [Tuber brumale]|nr:hypothetical protein HOY80DRAFT_1001891 [Tuber brumale]